MRLREIQHILTDATPGLEVNFGDPVGSPAGNAHRFEKPALVRSLQLLIGVPALRRAAQMALSHDALAQPGHPTTLVVAGEVADFSEHYLKPLRLSARLLLATINEILPEENPLSFSFQLPDFEPGRALEDFADEIRAIQLSFDEPLARTVGERLRLTAVDRGSLLLELAAATEPALVIVGAICTAALSLLALRQKYRRYELEHESLVLDVQLKESVVRANQAALDKVSRDLAERVVVLAGKEGDHETTNVIQAGIKQLSKQLGAGAALYVSGKASEAVQKVFPKPGDPPQLHDVALKELLAVNPSNDAEASKVGD